MPDEPNQPRLGQHGGDRRSEKAKAHQGTNAPNDGTLKIRGNTRPYTRARLTRDRPDLLVKVDAGEMTINAAAVEAGFRKRRENYNQAGRRPFDPRALIA